MVEFGNKLADVFIYIPEIKVNAIDCDFPPPHTPTPPPQGCISKPEIHWMILK